MKIAIVHDDLMRRGGAEKVALTISEMYPQAPIYTLAYRSELTYPEFKAKKIITSWFQIIARNELLMKWLFFPFGILAMRSIKLNGYDAVIMSTTYCAKYVRVGRGTTVFAYCYTPFRLAWNPNSYSVYKESNRVFRFFLDMVINTLKKVDLKASKKIDYFVAMTKDTKQRLIDAYNPIKHIPVINPAVELQHYSISETVAEYYLLVSRFEPYKRVDLAIDAFNENGKPLIVVGRGSQEQALKKRALSNIQFRSMLSNEELAELYRNCKAFIFPQFEDYGLTPIEANAAGRPVIAFGKGGVIDTMIPYQENSPKGTALFFDEQTVPALKSAIEKFETIHFETEILRKNAERFSKKRFKEELETFINKSLK
ncbi:MAG: glycosyltransferase [Cyclobacteriaceae bacterium]